MKPEDMRDDIPEDVREALSKFISDGHGASVFALRELGFAVRAKPRTVVIPRAEIPAPLTEMPESGVVWVVDLTHPDCVRRVCAKSFPGTVMRVVENDLAWATREDALAAFKAFTAWEDDDWIPHTPGDPMPCGSDLTVDVRFESGEVKGALTAIAWNWGVQNDGYSITAWRPAR